jgi:nitrogen fixation protein FixH
MNKRQKQQFDSELIAGWSMLGIIVTLAALVIYNLIIHYI